MRTLVEASPAFNQGAGIGRYSRNILSRLIETDPGDTWTLVRAPEERGEGRGLFPTSSHGNTRVVDLPFTRRNADRLWFRLGLPADIRFFAGPADVVYSPDFTAPPMFGVPRMLTVHDLAFMTHPDKTTEALRSYLERVVPRQVQRADKVAVVSNATKADLQRLLGVPDEKIVVARNAVDERFFHAESLSTLDKARLGIPNRYLLMVGTIEPRKNHVNALRALEVSGIGKELPLVIAGRPGWGFEPAMELIETMVTKGLVTRPSYVPDADLPSLVAGATAMIYPSWTEGFGLPVAEALAGGIPVVTGDAPALREVGGPFALYADPGDVDAIAEHIRHVAATTSSELERQQRREWTRQFSWESSTSIVLQSLRAIAHQ
jgi:glycosyltransferase involved in cell wall biosynthesis